MAGYLVGTGAPLEVPSIEETAAFTRGWLE